MISFPTSAFWLDNDEPDSKIDELQDWLNAGKRYAVIPAVNKSATGSIAYAALQGRIAPENICFYSPVPVTNLEAFDHRAAASECLSEQLELASCLGIKFFVFQRAGNLADTDLVSFCHLIAKSCGPTYASCRNQLVISCDAATDWDLWKCMSKFMPEMKLCLTLTSDYSWLDDEAFEKMMLRWGAEHITMLLCCRDSVKLNQAEQPSMSKRNREVVLNLGINRAATIIFQVDQLTDGSADDIADASLVPAKVGLPTGWAYAHKMNSWLQYVHQKYCEVSHDAAMRMIYKDVLQEPLQPLAFNLSLQQYMVFEEDIVKYAMYQAAIKEILLPMLEDASFASSLPAEAEPADECSGDELIKRAPEFLHIAYLGGGRGPLLNKCFGVLVEDGWQLADHHRITKGNKIVNIQFSLVEKNPAAIILLKSNLVRSPFAEWWKRVDLVEGDMRDWAPSRPVALAFSELLGSIADNELSPECMQLKCLAEDFKLIPRRTESFFQPITSRKLFEASRSNEDSGHVCNMVTYAPISTTLAVAFTFDHTNHAGVDRNGDNQRYARMTWGVPSGHDNWLHGFAGYFQAELTDNITLSTCPGSETPGLHSWYPMYLPIDQPIYCRAGDRVQLDIWRCADKNRVWYEWTASVKSGDRARIASRIHNLDGIGWSITK